MGITRIKKFGGHTKLSYQSMAMMEFLVGPFCGQFMFLVVHDGPAGLTL